MEIVTQSKDEVGKDISVQRALDHGEQIGT